MKKRTALAFVAGMVTQHMILMTIGLRMAARAKRGNLRQQLGEINDFIYGVGCEPYDVEALDADELAEVRTLRVDSNGIRISYYDPWDSA